MGGSPPAFVWRTESGVRNPKDVGRRTPDAPGPIGFPLCQLQEQSDLHSARAWVAYSRR